MSTARRAAVLLGLAIGILSLIVGGLAATKYDFETADAWWLVGWAGMSLIALAVAAPSRFTIRSVLAVMTLLAILLALFVILK
jgi:hypothetical protein